jgi:hypothetical protein
MKESSHIIKIQDIFEKYRHGNGNKFVVIPEILDQRIS